MFGNSGGDKHWNIGEFRREGKNRSTLGFQVIYVCMFKRKCIREFKEWEVICVVSLGVVSNLG